MQQALHAFAGGAGEGAGDVAEQFALDQAFRNRRAVDRHKGLLAALAGLVQLAGEDFLAAAGFALDQHRQVAVLDPHCQAQTFFHAWVEFGGRQRQARAIARQAPGRAEASVQNQTKSRAGQQAQGFVAGSMQALLIEDLADVLGQAAKTLQQQVPRRRVEGLQAAVVIPGQQIVRLTVDIARAAVGTQDPVALGAVHEKRLFDLPRALYHHLPDQVL